MTLSCSKLVACTPSPPFVNGARPEELVAIQDPLDAGDWEPWELHIIWTLLQQSLGNMGSCVVPGRLRKGQGNHLHQVFGTTPPVFPLAAPPRIHAERARSAPPWWVEEWAHRGDMPSVGKRKQKSSGLDLRPCRPGRFKLLSPCSIYWVWTLSPWFPVELEALTSPRLQLSSHLKTMSFWSW